MPIQGRVNDALEQPPGVEGTEGNEPGQEHQDQFLCGVDAEPG